MSSAPRYIPHYTVDDYLQWEGEWQLIDGIAIAMTPSPFGRHEQIVANAVHEFMSSIERSGCDCRVYAGLDWIVSRDTVLRPDVMIVCGSQPDGHLQKCPELAVEVLSGSTKTQDQVTKLQLYHENGVAYYVIIDPQEQRIEIYRWQARCYELEPPADHANLILPSGCPLAFSLQRLLR